MRQARAIFAGLILSFGIFCFVGCQEYVFEPVFPGFISSRSVDVTIPQTAQIDFLFVVDDSRSMTGNQNNLANNLGVFIDLLLDANDQRIAEGRDPLDFRIAVTSTSVRERLALPDMNINRTTYNPTEGCADGTAYVIASGEAYPAGDLMAPAGNDVILTSDQFQNDQTNAIRQFQENIRLGVCGSSQEEGLEGMRLAIDKNPNFWRDQSRLVVVFLSDEEDASDMTGQFVNMVYDPEDPAAEDGLIYARSHPDYRDQLTPVSEYKAFLDAEAANRGGTVAIAAIVSAVGDPPHNMEAEVWPNPEQYNCFDEQCARDACQHEPDCDPNNEQDLRGDRIVGSPHWCGGDSPGKRYLELARMYPREDHIMDAICQTDFSSTLQELVRIADVDQCLQLPAPPQNDDTSLVLVRIERDGEFILCNPPEGPGENACDDPDADWWYDPAALQVCLCPDSACQLEPGDSYRLSYVEQACSADNPCAP